MSDRAWDSLQSYKMTWWLNTDILNFAFDLQMHNKSSQKEPSTSDQRIVKLSSVQTLLVIRPRWRRHAAVGVQQDSDAADKKKEKQQHQESDETHGRSPLRVFHHGLQHRRPPGEPERRLRGEVIIYNPVIRVAHAGIV